MSDQQLKVCKVCKVEKTVESFSPNQYGKDNRVLRRPVCRECYSKKIKLLIPFGQVYFIISLKGTGAVSTAC